MYQSDVDRPKGFLCIIVMLIDLKVSCVSKCIKVMLIDLKVSCVSK